MAEQDKSKQHPFVEAIPPATDYVTYLTLIEYNLKREDLSLLDELLQDERLTTNIGWDLVLLLLPLLPDSEPCLRTIARQGNPREVILKATEALRIIKWESDGESEDDDEEVSANAKPDGGSATTGPEPAKITLPAQQFTTLLDMLSILHLRIKTKYPSRFMSTSLQAALAAYNDVPSTIDPRPLINALAGLVQTLSGSRRPALPPRQNTGNAGRTASDAEPAATDPEAQAGTVSDDDGPIQKRLLHSFVTHLLEQYVSNLDTNAIPEDAPGLLLSGRVFETSFPLKKVPGRKTWLEKSKSMSAIQQRDDGIRKLIALVTLVELEHDDLLRASTQVPKPTTSNEIEEDPPSSAEDIPLSACGCLIILADEQTSTALSAEKKQKKHVRIFPEQAAAIKQVIGTAEAGGMGTAGTEPEAIIDAVLALGLIALEHNEVGELNDDEIFMQYLQTVSLLSANSPSPSLRFHAHILTSTVLRSHPSDMVRLTFIRDTLEHCPYENLKTSAVSWIKAETLEANPPNDASKDDETRSVFASPVALEAVGVFLFPDLTQEMTTTNLSETWTKFKMSLGFYLASLNFYYLLLAAKHLRAPLQVASLHQQHDIEGSMMGPLRQASQNFRKSLQSGTLAVEEGEQGVHAAMLDLDILDDVLDRVEQGVIDLNVTG